MAMPIRTAPWKGILLRLCRQQAFIQEARCLQTTAVCCKKKAGHVKVGKGFKPVTYEQANPPYRIGVRKSWNSLHTANLHEEEGAPERTVEDVFIRKFIYGTFHNTLAAETIIKRRANQIIICLVLRRMMPPGKYYFLIAYSEALLSYWLKCIVKLEVQVVDDMPIYKWL
ncbi:small ribosomal subunit protein uS3mA-like [Ptychodera flava]|uniref:small ribosomal subunit protein uS3mA-like n=1 Tax=Ptychodera flava TaxID=63121 RepID=UPI00396A9127